MATLSRALRVIQLVILPIHPMLGPICPMLGPDLFEIINQLLAKKISGLLLWDDIWSNLCNAIWNDWSIISQALAKGTISLPLSRWSLNAIENGQSVINQARRRAWYRYDGSNDQLLTKSGKLALYTPFGREPCLFPAGMLVAINQVLCEKLVLHVRVIRRHQSQ